MKKSINTTKAPGAIGPYSQAVDSGDLIFVSGQLPIDPVSGNMLKGISLQTEQSLNNVKAILTEEGLTMANVVKSTVFLKDMEMFSEMNKVYASFFEEPYPARAAVEVARLPKDALVEIEVIANKG